MHTPVADSLQVTLNVESRTRLAARRPVRIDSFELYLLGRHYQLQRNPDAMVKAINYEQQAVTADPKFALAYAGLATHAWPPSITAIERWRKSNGSSSRLLEKGLAVNPNLPELYTAGAVLRTEQWQLGRAEEDLKRAIALNPNYADAYVRLGAAYEYAGRPRDALAEYTKEVGARSAAFHFTRGGA